VIETASDTVEHTNDDGKFYSVRILWLKKYSINSSKSTVTVVKQVQYL